MMDNSQKTVIFESVLSQVQESRMNQDKLVTSYAGKGSEISGSFADLPGLVLHSRIRDPAVKLSEEALEYAIGTIVHINDKVQEQIESQTKKPSTIELTFGLKITGGFATIVKAEAECEISVKATWGFKPPSPKDSV